MLIKNQFKKSDMVTEKRQKTNKQNKMTIKQKLNNTKETVGKATTKAKKWTTRLGILAIGAVVILIGSGRMEISTITNVFAKELTAEELTHQANLKKQESQLITKQNESEAVVNDFESQIAELQSEAKELEAKIKIEQDYQESINEALKVNAKGELIEEEIEKASEEVETVIETDETK